MVPGYKPTTGNLLPKRPKYDYGDSVLINRNIYKLDKTKKPLTLISNYFIVLVGMVIQP